MDLAEILTIAREITVTGLLVAGIYGFLSGHLVTRFHYDEMKRHYENEIQDIIRNEQ